MERQKDISGKTLKEGLWQIYKMGGGHGLGASWSHQLTVFQGVDQLSVLAREDGARQV